LKRSFVAAIALILTVAIATGYFVNGPRYSERILIAGTVVYVEYARTFDEQVRGLSGRDSLPHDHGMLFIFDHEDTWAIWMKGMRFGLDIIWFGADQRIVYIQQNVDPCHADPCPIFRPTQKALYVLEVNAGFVGQHDLGLGDGFVYLP